MNEVCGNCKPEKASLLGNGWDVLPAPGCAGGCQAFEAAECCPELQAFVVSANSIGEVRVALRAHQRTECASCGSTQKSVIGDHLPGETKRPAFDGTTPGQEVA